MQKKTKIIPGLYWWGGIVCTMYYYDGENIYFYKDWGGDLIWELSEVIPHIGVLRHLIDHERLEFVI